MSTHSSKYVLDNHKKGQQKTSKNRSNSSGYFESSMDDSEDLNLICVSDHENDNDNSEDVTCRSPLPNTVIKRKRSQPSPATPASLPSSPVIPICPGLSPSSNLRKYLTENDICIRRIKELYGISGWNDISPPPGYTADMDNIGWKEREESISPVLKRVQEGKRRRRRLRSRSPSFKRKDYTSSQNVAKRTSAKFEEFKPSFDLNENTMDESEDNRLFECSQRLEAENAENQANQRQVDNNSNEFNCLAQVREIRRDSVRRRLPLELQETIVMPATPDLSLQNCGNYNSQLQGEGNWAEDDEGDAIMSQVTYMDESVFTDKSNIKNETETASIFDEDGDSLILSIAEC